MTDTNFRYVSLKSLSHKPCTVGNRNKDFCRQDVYLRNQQRELLPQTPHIHGPFKSISAPKPKLKRLKKTLSACFLFSSQVSLFSTPILKSFFQMWFISQKTWNLKRRCLGERINVIVPFAHIRIQPDFNG